MKSLSTSEQYFPLVVFVMLYNVVPTFEAVNEVLKSDNSNDVEFVLLP